MTNANVKFYNGSHYSGEDVDAVRNSIYNEDSGAEMADSDLRIFCGSIRQKYEKTFIGEECFDAPSLMAI